MKILSSRKGQFYILISLLLISYAFALARQDTPVRKPRDSFQLLHEGFMREGAAVINGAVYQGGNVTSVFANFSNSYAAFARSSEPRFTFAWLLKEQGSLTIGNRFGSDLNATVGGLGYVVSPDTELTVPVATTVLRTTGIDYTYVFSSEDIQLKALFRISDRLSRRVFVSG